MAFISAMYGSFSFGVFRFRLIAVIETSQVSGVIDERFEVDEAVGANMEVRDLEALLLEVAARVEDALVLGLCRYDVSFLLGVKSHHALDGDVVGLGGAGCETISFGDAAMWLATCARARSMGLVDLPAVHAGVRGRRGAWHRGLWSPPARWLACRGREVRRIFSRLSW